MHFSFLEALKSLQRRGHSCEVKKAGELDLVLVSEGGVVFRNLQTASEVTGAGKQGGDRGLWRQTGTDLAAGLHAVFENP